MPACCTWIAPANELHGVFSKASITRGYALDFRFEWFNIQRDFQAILAIKAGGPCVLKFLEQSIETVSEILHARPEVSDS